MHSVLHRGSAAVAREAAPCHLRAPGNVTICGLKITRRIDAWSSPKMVTCKHCLRAIEGAR